MTNSRSVWQEYELKEIISDKVFKAKKQNTNEMFAIKEIIGLKKISHEKPAPAVKD